VDATEWLIGKGWALMAAMRRKSAGNTHFRNSPYAEKDCPATDLATFSGCGHRQPVLFLKNLDLDQTHCH
jgi:hypothetical protein